MQQAFKIGLIIALILVLLAIIPVVILEFSGILANVGYYIINLFHKADLNPNNSGFDEAFQLILIAFFFGWTIHRFKNIQKK